MCGLFGIFPAIHTTKGQKAALRNLFLWLGAINDDRGGHSWGMWGRETVVNKGTGYFINNVHHIKKVLRHWDVVGGNWMCGHTRYATHGAKSKANAHPFKYNNLILAHNGVLDVHAPVKGEIPVVDSDHLAMFLSQNLANNPDTPWEEVFRDSILNVTGSIGLLMSDEIGNLRAYTSMQELHFATGVWGFAISSSKSNLENALDAAGLTYETIQAMDDDMLVAPWYTDSVDYHAPSLGYSSKSRGYVPRDWRDYQATSPTISGGTLEDYNDYYTKPGVHSALKEDIDAEFPLEEFGTERPGDWESLDDEMAHELCELCASREVGPQPSTWTDPDSGRCYLVCMDCDAMFYNGIDSDDRLDYGRVEELLNALEKE